MGKTYDKIDQKITDFIQRQKMFFVATAPLADDGHINLSPKGLDAFRILDPHTVAYADLVGSGIETVAHLRENGRIVLMFCAFSGAPMILRLHGQGEVVQPSHDEFEQLSPSFTNLPGLRSIIRVTCSRISDSCGFGVPLLDFRGERTQLVEWAEKKGANGLLEYQQRANVRSIDGLPGIET